MSQYKRFLEANLLEEKSELYSTLDEIQSYIELDGNEKYGAQETLESYLTYTSGELDAQLIDFMLEKGAVIPDNAFELYAMNQHANIDGMELLHKYDAPVLNIDGQDNALATYLSYQHDMLSIVDKDMVKKMTELGFDINHKGKNGQTPIMAANTEANPFNLYVYRTALLTEDIKAMESLGADLTVSDVDGNTLAHYIAKNISMPKQENLDALLYAGEKCRASLYFQNHDHQTPADVLNFDNRLKGTVADIQRFQEALGASNVTMYPLYSRSEDFYKPENEQAMEKVSLDYMKKAMTDIAIVTMRTSENPISLQTIKDPETTFKVKDEKTGKLVPIEVKDIEDGQKIYVFDKAGVNTGTFDVSANYAAEIGNQDKKTIISGNNEIISIGWDVNSEFKKRGFDIDRWQKYELDEIQKEVLIDDLEYHSTGGVVMFLGDEYEKYGPKGLLDQFRGYTVQGTNNLYDVTINKGKEITMPESWKEPRKDDLYRNIVLAKDQLSYLFEGMPGNLTKEQMEELDLSMGMDSSWRGDAFTQEELNNLIDTIEQLENGQVCMEVLEEGLSDLRDGMEPRVMTYNPPRTNTMVSLLSEDHRPGGLSNVYVDNNGQQHLTIKAIDAYELGIALKTIHETSKYFEEQYQRKDHELIGQSAIEIDAPIENAVPYRYTSHLEITKDNNGHAHISNMDVENQKQAAFPNSWLTDPQRTQELGIVSISSNPYSGITSVELVDADAQRISSVIEASQTFQVAANYIRAASNEIATNVYPAESNIYVNNDYRMPEERIDSLLPPELVNRDTAGINGNIFSMGESYIAVHQDYCVPSTKVIVPMESIDSNTDREDLQNGLKQQFPGVNFEIKTESFDESISVSFHTPENPAQLETMIRAIDEKAGEIAEHKLEKDDILQE